MDIEKRIKWAAPAIAGTWAIMMWGLAQTNFHWPPLLVFGAIFFGAVGVLVTTIVWCHIAWVWIRSKGLQSGPAIVIAICLIGLVGGGIWGGLTWKHPALNPAELSRPLELSAEDLQVTKEGDAFILRVVSFMVANTGNNALRYRLKDCSVYFDETPRAQELNMANWFQIQPGFGTSSNFRFSAPVEIPAATKVITVDMVVDYDEVPSTGHRESVRKYEYRVISLSDNKFDIILLSDKEL